MRSDDPATAVCKPVEMFRLSMLSERRNLIVPPVGRSCARQVAAGLAEAESHADDADAVVARMTSSVTGRT